MIIGSVVFLVGICVQTVHFLAMNEASVFTAVVLGAHTVTYWILIALFTLCEQSPFCDRFRIRFVSLAVVSTFFLVGCAPCLVFSFWATFFTIVRICVICLLNTWEQSPCAHRK